MLAPLYIAEMAPANIRGKLVSFNQFAIVTGMLVVYFVNYSIVQGQTDEWIYTVGWRRMFLSEVIPAFLFFIFLLFVPKTPRFQVMRGKDEKAMKVLSRLNDPERATSILRDIRTSFDVKRAHWLTYGWGVVIIGFLLSVFQQFVGINVVLYYAPEIFRGMGMETDASILQTIIVGAINMLFTVLAIFTVDSFGRKKLMLIGSVVMAVSMIGLGTVLYLANYRNCGFIAYASLYSCLRHVLGTRHMGTAFRNFPEQNKGSDGSCCCRAVAGKSTGVLDLSADE